MRIAYVCYWNMASEDGVTKKILGQVAHWRARGHDVGLFPLVPGPLRPRWSGTRRLVRDVEAFAPDVAYLRLDLFLPPLRKLLRRFPTVLELNTDDRAELALRPLHARLYNIVNRRLFLAEARGFVAVTGALAAPLRPLGKPVAVIGNGVDLDAFPALPVPLNSRPRLVYVGASHQRWQGLDKLTALAAAEPGWDFDVVGPSPEELPTRPSNVTVHGFLTREAYEPIVARAEVAVGPLALHRKHMDEACPLKLREYLAYGLPTVIGYRDTDFPAAEPWFLLRVANVEGNVVDELPRIRAFVEDVRGRRVGRAAVAHLAAGAKEEARLRFLESIVAP